MKKIFWTTVVLLGIIVLFWAYVRLFNHNLGAQIARGFAGSPSEIQTGTVIDTTKNMDEINEKLGAIQDKLENILQTLGQETPTETAVTPYDASQDPLNTLLKK